MSWKTMIKKAQFAIMIITSKKVEYAGLRIGSTWADILKFQPDAVAHGSEIEGRVSVKVGNHLIRLDHYESSYDFDQSNLSPDTQILEFWIEKVDLYDH